MSSIDQAQMELLTRFYERQLRPLAERTHKAESKDGSAGSYYLKRAKTTLSRADFELDLSDEPSAARTLKSRWQGTPLQELAEPLMKLAPKFREAEERAEVSAFVYEMF